MTISNSKKAVLHMAAIELGLTREEYEAALLSCAGVTSSADHKLGDKGFKAIMAHFEHCGFKRKIQPGTSKRIPNAFYNPKEFSGREGIGWASEKQIFLIHKLWWNLRGSYWGIDMRSNEYPKLGKRALTRFISTRFHVDGLRWMKFQTAGKVINALKAIEARRPGLPDPVGQ